MIRALSSFVAALVCGAWLVAGASPAQAHAAYKDSDPKSGETVSSTPSEVWVEFTEPPAQGSFLQVFDACGAQVDGGDTQLDEFRMMTSVTGTARGKYVVRFRAISAVDSHETHGSHSFTVRTGPDCAARTPSAEDADEGRPGPDAADGADGGGRRSGSSGNVWDGIPIGSFLMALAIAAVIGAAGGRVYAGILGPRA